MAHDGGGHLGVRKTRDRLNRLFTWPGMARDISHYVESCPLCLKANKAGNKVTLAFKGGYDERIASNTRSVNFKEEAC